MYADHQGQWEAVDDLHQHDIRGIAPAWPTDRSTRVGLVGSATKRRATLYKRNLFGCCCDLSGVGGYAMLWCGAIAREELVRHAHMPRSTYYAILCKSALRLCLFASRPRPSAALQHGPCWAAHRVCRPSIGQWEALYVTYQNADSGIAHAWSTDRSPRVGLVGSATKRHATLYKRNLSGCRCELGGVAGYAMQWCGAIAREEHEVHAHMHRSTYYAILCLSALRHCLFASRLRPSAALQHGPCRAAHRLCRPSRAMGGRI